MAKRTGLYFCQFAQSVGNVVFGRVEKNSWHVLYCAPRCEFAVAKDLKACGHEALVPVLVSLKRVARKSKHKERIEFPRFSQYVFFRLSGPADLRQIRDAQYVLGMGEQPASISDEAVQALMYVVEPAGSPNALKAGDRVEAVSTIVAGKSGIIIALKRHRADVSLEGHAKIVNLPLDCLKAA